MADRQVGMAGRILFSLSTSDARVRRAALCLGLACSVLTFGCTGRWAKKSADREVYPILADKQEKALGEARAFTIEPTPLPLAEELLARAGTASDEFTTTGLRFNLNDALVLAIAGNPQYQTRKESLYVSALNLTGARNEYSPMFSAFVSGGYRRDPLVGGASRSSSLDAGVGVMQFLGATGGRLTINFLTSLLRSDGGLVESATGAVSASLVQPLLRGAGPLVAMEPLRQAERDVIYDVREFARFERGFVVDTIDEYLRMLQRLDVVENEWRSYVSLQQGRERSEALAEAGRLDLFQVFQARQQELNARNRWLNAKTTFVLTLDRFKVRLGMPTELNIFPDQADLRALIAGGLQPIELESEPAVALAVERRLDYQTALNVLEDVERRIKVSENRLLPDLGVSANIGISDEGNNQPLSLSWRERRTRLGIDFEAPLERTNERNAYRRALIAREQARRDAELLRNNIALEVRGAYQTLEQARNTWRIQQTSLELAERRIDSAKLLLEAGRKTVRDVLESEEEWITARNAVTRALVDYTIARLNFLLAIEAIDVDIEGELIEKPVGSDIVNAGGEHVPTP